MNIPMPKIRQAIVGATGVVGGYALRYPLERPSDLPTYKLGKGLSLRSKDIGRRRLLTQPRPGRQSPVISAFRVSEG